MEARKILTAKGINPRRHIFYLTAEEALENIVNVMEEYCPDVDITNLSKSEMLKLLMDYGQCILLYHPEDDHQERAAILRNIDIFRKYGLTDEDISVIEFF